MGYTSKYAQEAMQKTVGGGDPDKKKKKEDKGDSKKKLQTYKAGGSGQDTKGQDKDYAKNSKRNVKVAARQDKDLSQYKKTKDLDKYKKNSSKSNRTYKF